MVPWGIILGCTWEVFFPWHLLKQLDGEDAVLAHDDAPRLGMPGQRHAVDLEFYPFTEYSRDVPNAYFFLATHFSLSLVTSGVLAVTFSCVGRQGWCSGPLCALLFFKQELLPPLPALHVVIGTDPLYFKKLGRGLIYKIQICHTDNVDF